ncbi:hypothetical protein Droror1_Dr00024018, partial [Drosera rotundifolia]
MMIEASLLLAVWFIVIAKNVCCWITRGNSCWVCDLLGFGVVDGSEWKQRLVSEYDAASFLLRYILVVKHLNTWFSSSITYTYYSVHALEAFERRQDVH